MQDKFAYLNQSQYYQKPFQQTQANQFTGEFKAIQENSKELAETYTKIQQQDITLSDLLKFKRKSTPQTLSSTFKIAQPLQKINSSQILKTSPTQSLNLESRPINIQQSSVEDKFALPRAQSLIKSTKKYKLETQPSPPPIPFNTQMGLYDLQQIQQQNNEQIDRELQLQLSSREQHAPFQFLTKLTGRQLLKRINRMIQEKEQPLALEREPNSPPPIEQPQAPIQILPKTMDEILDEIDAKKTFFVLADLPTAYQAVSYQLLTATIVRKLSHVQIRHLQPAVQLTDYIRQACAECEENQNCLNELLEQQIGFQSAYVQFLAQIFGLEQLFVQAFQLTKQKQQFGNLVRRFDQARQQIQVPLLSQQLEQMSVEQMEVEVQKQLTLSQQVVCKLEKLYNDQVCTGRADADRLQNCLAAEEEFQKEIRTVENAVGLIQLIQLQEKLRNSWRQFMELGVGYM